MYNAIAGAPAITVLAKARHPVLASGMIDFSDFPPAARIAVFLRPATCLAALAIAPVSALADSHDPAPPLDPAAVELVQQAADFLAGQPRLRVDWFVSYDEVIDGREKITHLRSGSNLLDREHGFHAYAEDGDRTREYFFDGETVTAYHVEDHAYARAEIAGSFADLVAVLQVEYGVTLPIWQILSHEAGDELLADAETGAYLGLTRIAGQAAHHLAFSSYDHDWQLWVADDPDRPLLLMLVGTDPYSQGWPQYRAYFTGWDFEPEIPEGAFTFVPDEDAVRMVWPRVGRLEDGGQ